MRAGTVVPATETHRSWRRVTRAALNEGISAEASQLCVGAGDRCSAVQEDGDPRSKHLELLFHRLHPADQPTGVAVGQRSGGTLRSAHDKRAAKALQFPRLVVHRPHSTEHMFVDVETTSDLSGVGTRSLAPAFGTSGYPFQLRVSISRMANVASTSPRL